MVFRPSSMDIAMEVLNTIFSTDIAENGKKEIKQLIDSRSTRHSGKLLCSGGPSLAGYDPRQD